MFYSENPNLGLKTVILPNGEREYRFNCRKIKDTYYVKGKDCFQVKGLWYRVDSGLIVKDWETGEWLLKEDLEKMGNIIEGVVGFDEYKKPILGFFTLNPYNNCILFDRINPVSGEKQGWMVINQDILIENGFAENFSEGMFYPPNNIKELQTPKNIVDHTQKGYNLEDNHVEYAQKKIWYEAYPTKFSKDVVSYARMLGDTTFGMELECSKGFLPVHIQNRTGVVICRDGSLNDGNGKPGPEFVTIPLNGAKGLQTLVDISRELSKRTTIDIKCSLHLHLGNLPTTRMFIISLFRLCSKIQNELFTMFPYYKTNPDGIKHKNYNQKLPSLSIYAAEASMTREEFTEYINTNYRKLFSWLAEGYQPDMAYNRKSKKHPHNNKWERHKRYYWMNVMNTIFSDRNTVEFRLHTPTTNAQKIINWLFICNAIVRYANTHASEVLLSHNGITLNQILSYYNQFGSKGQFLVQYLNAYIKERKEAFYADYLKGDYLSEWEMKQDKDYVFTFENVNYLF